MPMKFFLSKLARNHFFSDLMLPTVYSDKLGTATNGGFLSRISVFFIIIVCFMLRLTKLLLKSVLVLFLRQERYIPIHTRPLDDRDGFYASFS